MELSGNILTSVVFESADTDSAVTAIVEHMLSNPSPTALPASSFASVPSLIQRVFVQENVLAHFVTRLQEEVAKMRVGECLDKTTDAAKNEVFEGQAKLLSEFVSIV